MEKPIVKKKILRFNIYGEGIEVEDLILSEKHMSFIVGCSVATNITMTPGNEELWALGNLFTNHVINNIEDVISMKIDESSISVKIECRQKKQQIRPPKTDWTVPPSLIDEGIKWISEAPLYRKTGCTHVAALLSHEGKRLFLAEDIKRHNAVDKAIGWLIKHKYNSENSILLTSGRLPEDMVLKGVYSKIPLIASVSAATEQGVLAAEAANITLIGFVRNGRMNVYTHSERIV